MERPALFWLSLAGIVGGVATLLGLVLPWLLKGVLGRLLPGDATTFYNRVLQPQRSLLVLVGALTVVDLVGWGLLGLVWQVSWYSLFELPLTLTLTLTLGLLLIRSFRGYFDTYVMDAVFQSGRKANSELVVVAKFLANLGVVFILIIVFGQTHQFNIIGILASLGVGGIAIAFAAQQVLQQLLGGVVLYIDRPFTVDDYVGLPDGTFGRVEAIGLRSSKIRTSGKGTLAIIPNSVVIQGTIENFTGAKKVMAIVYLNLYREVGEEERALIRQVIQESTQDIFGIDSRSTDITFRQLDANNLTQVQTTLFVLGAGGGSMEIRRQLLDIANQKITQRLHNYGISFDVEEPTVYVDSPITV